MSKTKKVRTKKEFTCTSTTSGKQIIPDGFIVTPINGDDFRQVIFREEENVIDAMKWSVNSAFGHLREIIEMDNLESKEPFSLHGQTHKDKLTLKELMKKYPSNFWYSEVYESNKFPHIVFENVDYSTVKVESQVTDVEDVPYDTTYWNGRSNGDFLNKDQKIYKIYLGVGGAEDDCHIVKFGDRFGKTGVSIDTFDKDKLGMFLFEKFEDEFPLEVHDALKEFTSDESFLEKYNSANHPFRYEITDEEPQHYIYPSNDGAFGFEKRWLTSSVIGIDF